jgi:tetratricopeptide (TPR) repeat protein
MEEKRDKFMAQGKASFEKEDFIAARLHFKNALQLDDKFAEGHLWLGKTELHLKNPRGAFGAFSKAVELNPNLLEGQILLGNLC